MAKSASTHLLIPGETAWETWTIVPDQPATLNESYEVKFPSEIESLPAGDLIFLFPVQAYTALPLKVQTGDVTLFPDLCATHAERLGLRPDPLAGQLTDIFPVSVSTEESTLLHLVLKNPSSESLPKKSPKAFDISARSIPSSGNTISLWRELNQWVFVIHHQGNLIYSQATSSTGISPDENLIREIRIATAQLAMQGIPAIPDRAIVWSNDPQTQTSALSKTLSIRVDLEPRPTPSLPTPLSQLLPADVRAARSAARKRQNMILSIAALVLFYLGSIGYFGYGLWQTHSSTKQLTDKIKKIAPHVERFQTHSDKWRELEYGISQEYDTLDILDRIVKCVPAKSGLRLITAEITASNLSIQAEAEDPKALTNFLSKLKANNSLVNYKWNDVSPREVKRGWGFTFVGSLPEATP